jgi:hypothetical protein
MHRVKCQNLPINPIKAIRASSPSQFCVKSLTFRLSEDAHVALEKPVAYAEHLESRFDTPVAIQNRSRRGESLNREPRRQLSELNQSSTVVQFLFTTTHQRRKTLGGNSSRAEIKRVNVSSALA